MKLTAGGPKNICIVYPKKGNLAFIVWAMLGLEGALADVPLRIEQIKNEGLSQLDIGCVVRIHPEKKCYIYHGIREINGKEVVMISPNKELGHLYGGEQYFEVVELSPARMERVKSSLRPAEYGKLKQIRAKPPREGLDLILPDHVRTLNNKKMLGPKCLLVASRSRVTEFLSTYTFKRPFMSHPISLSEAIGCAEAIECAEYGASCVYTNSLEDAADFLRRVSNSSLPIVIDGLEHIGPALKDVLYSKEGAKRQLVIISDNSERAQMLNLQYNLKFWRVHDVEVNVA
jgi:hypothetical protein